jgi:hypothetical protein
MTNNLNQLLDNVEDALWQLQEYFNYQPKENIPNYQGMCQNIGALKTYQLRCDFAEKFKFYRDKK